MYRWPCMIIARKIVEIVEKALCEARAFSAILRIIIMLSLRKWTLITLIFTLWPVWHLRNINESIADLIINVVVGYTFQKVIVYFHCCWKVLFNFELFNLLSSQINVRVSMEENEENEKSYKNSDEFSGPKHSSTVNWGNSGHMGNSGQRVTVFLNFQ